MSLLDTIKSQLTSKPQQKFIIYTMDYKYSKNPKDNDKNIALEFDTLLTWKFSNEVNVAFEPLENSDFSSDTLHDNPFYIDMLVAKSYVIDGKTVKTRADGVKIMQKTLAQLEDYIHNKTMLIIIPNNLLLKTYQNIKLISYNQTYDNKTNYLRIPLRFQQIRPTQLQGGIQDAKNPNNNNTADGGEVQPQPKQASDVPDIA